MKAWYQLDYDTAPSGYDTSGQRVKMWINMYILESMKYTVFQKYHSSYFAYKGLNGEGLIFNDRAQEKQKT